MAEPGEYDRTPQGPALAPAGESGSSWVRGTGLQPRAPSTKQELTAVRSGAGDSGQLRSRATPGVHDCTGHGTDMCPAGAWGSGLGQWSTAGAVLLGQLAISGDIFGGHNSGETVRLASGGHLAGDAAKRPVAHGTDRPPRWRFSPKGGRSCRG